MDGYASGNRSERLIDQNMLLTMDCDTDELVR